MLVRLSGLLEQIEGGSAVIATADGCAREVLVPAYLAALLSGKAGAGVGPEGLVGRVVRLHVVEYLESVNQGTSFTPRVLGFGSARERGFFELLTSVKGLGNRRALRALAAEPGMIARAIVERDTRVLQKLPEIGPKLAETIVHELKSKAEVFVGLRGMVEVVDEADARGGMREPAGVFAAGALIERIEMKAGVGGEAGAGEVEGRANGVERSAVGKTRKRSAGAGDAEGGGDKAPARSAAAAVVAPPPVHETVRVLISLGEQPLEAERMVARAVDRAASEGRLVEVASASALLAASYAAR
ncbi:MAG: hypothetical protein KF768_13310 [Phycisphaeraceae bacterium]|nr:hypothetical protein [Phycisphaeraceae bacterium]